MGRSSKKITPNPRACVSIDPRGARPQIVSYLILQPFLNYTCPFKTKLFALLLLISSLSIDGIAAISTYDTTAVRGVWLTNVASDALYSRQNIAQAVAQCAALGFNTIFVVTYNGGYTLFPSQVARSVVGEAIHPDFAGRDPLQEVIEEAHQRNIRVFAWFEYGFASSHQDSTGGLLIQHRPAWASRDAQGKITEKNGFQWVNPFHPEVQSFMTRLVLEAVENYDLDGIQGDDRLPALPSNGGYDAYTDSLYRSEHSDNPPPAYAQDYGWIKWRSQKLTDFLVDFVDTLRATDPNLLISMAPSIYPWSEENYLQDWPTWLKMGLVDLMIPQVYRYDIDAYRREIDKVYTLQVDSTDKQKVIPGVLLQVNDYNPTEDFLAAMIDYNRRWGVHGEVYFFYEGIKQFKDFFTSRYSVPNNRPQ